MSLFQEKQTKSYLLFLCICSVCLLVMAAIFSQIQTQNIKRMLFEREQAIASSLLDQGVEQDAIAAAINSAEASKEGQRFLQKIGHTQRTAAWLLPAVKDVTDSNRNIILIFALGAVMLLLGGSLFYLRRREQLYIEAVSIVQSFREGDFSRHLPRNQTGEIYQLFAQVDQLATALQAKSEAEHCAKEFLKNTISDISHQLKTPLAALQMYTEIIAEEPGRTQTVQKFADKSMQSLERMEQLIQTLLKVMRLDAGSITFEKEDCQVVELIKKSIKQLEVRAKIEKKSILMDGNDQQMVNCDPNWTSEALTNLVKNALDHTEEYGVIRITWSCSAVMLRIMVSDNGCGIAPEDINHIFKRFYRSTRSSDIQGAGLGLPLAKAVVEEQGGLLSVKSVPNEGAAFTVAFPLHA